MIQTGSHSISEPEPRNPGANDNAASPPNSTAPPNTPDSATSLTPDSGHGVTAESSAQAADPQPQVSRNPEGEQRSLELALAAARTADEIGGYDILILDMRATTPMFDYFVIATGTSRRQLHAMSEDIDHKLEDDLNDKRMNIDGYDESRWIVLDYATVVIHLFDEETRQFYGLEALWADSPKVDWVDK